MNFYYAKHVRFLSLTALMIGLAAFPVYAMDDNMAADKGYVKPIALQGLSKATSSLDTVEGNPKHLALANYTLQHASLEHSPEPRRVRISKLYDLIMQQNTYGFLLVNYNPGDVNELKVIEFHAYKSDVFTFFNQMTNWSASKKEIEHHPISFEEVQQLQENAIIGIQCSENYSFQDVNDTLAFFGGQPPEVTLKTLKFFDDCLSEDVMLSFDSLRYLTLEQRKKLTCLALNPSSCFNERFDRKEVTILRQRHDNVLKRLEIVEDKYHPLSIEFFLCSSELPIDVAKSILNILHWLNAEVSKKNANPEY